MVWYSIPAIYLCRMQRSRYFTFWTESNFAKRWWDGHVIIPFLVECPNKSWIPLPLCQPNGYCLDKITNLSKSQGYPERRSCVRESQVVATLPKRYNCLSWNITKGFRSLSYCCWSYEARAYSWNAFLINETFMGKYCWISWYYQSLGFQVSSV